MINVKIFRFDPDADSAPYLRDYRISNDCRDSTVLDVLEFLKRQDPTLRFRRPHHESIRLADGININGENRLAHATRMGLALGAGNTVVLRPLTGMQVIHDLIVEMLPADERLYSLFQQRAERACENAALLQCRDRSVAVA